MRATNNGGGVAVEIGLVKGKGIETRARKRAPTHVGKAVMATAGKLEAEYAVNKQTTERSALIVRAEDVYLPTQRALWCMARLKIRSIAFLELGIGVGGVDPEGDASIIVKAFRKHADKVTMLI